MKIFLLTMILYGKYKKGMKEKTAGGMIYAKILQMTGSLTISQL